MSIVASTGNRIQRIQPPTNYNLSNANPTGTIYLQGDNTTANSIREVFDGQHYILQKLVNGNWTAIHTADENSTTILKSVKTGVGSVHLGDLHSMSSAGENVIFLNNQSETVWFPIWQGVSVDGSTNIMPEAREYTSALVTLANGTCSNTGSINTPFTHTTTENHSIYQLTVVPAETWSGNVTFFGYFGALNVVSMDRTISAVTGEPLTIVLDYPVDLRVGNMLTAYIQKQDGSFTNLALRPIFSDMVSVYYSAKLKAFTDSFVGTYNDLSQKAPVASPNIYQAVGATNIATFGTQLDVGWMWNVPITINNPISNGTLSNYPINVIFNTAYPKSLGKMQSLCQDLRFVDALGMTQYAYYIQSGQVAGDINNFFQSLWVQIPSLPTGTTTINLLYGNSTATDAQGPPLTFGGAPIQPSVAVGTEAVYIASQISSNVTITTTGVQANGSQLVRYLGNWNATTGLPTIPAASSANQGFYYVVNVAGSSAIGTNDDWDVGDVFVSNGTTWDRIPQQITVITDSVDFNTMTARGMFASDIAPSANYPTSTAPPTWRLWVVISGSITYQWMYGNHGTFLRNYNGSVWSTWLQMDRDTPVTVVAAGATAITAVPGLTVVNPSTGTGTVNLPTITQLLDGKVFYVKKSDSTNSTTMTINGNIDGVTSTSVSTHVPFTSYQFVADYTRNMYWIV